MSATERTQDEIVARVEHARKADMFGWRCEVLIPTLDFEHAKPYLKDGTTAEEWEADRRDDGVNDLLARAGSYLHFAFGKAYNERGLSAGRSIQKLGEVAWLLGHDELAARMEREDGYEPYGLPLLRAFAKEFGFPVPDRSEF